MTVVPSSRNPYTWVQLTRKQIDAILAVASGIDRRQGELNRYLPKVGDRFAFHAAMTNLARLQAAAEEVR